jgi:hypothetical protein
VAVGTAEPDSAENTGATASFGLRRFFRRFYWLLDTPASTTPLPPRPCQCRCELGVTTQVAPHEAILAMEYNPLEIACHLLRQRRYVLQPKGCRRQTATLGPLRK